jgi:hypothetical protein
MKNLLKEYIQIILKATQVADTLQIHEARPSRGALQAESPTVTLKDFANQIGGVYNTKYGYHVRFSGTIKQLRTAVGKTESKVVQPKSGDPMERSGKYSTYIFDLTDTRIQLPNGQIITSVPVVLLDQTKGDLLSSGKMLGYGAEHAVYASLAGLSNDQMLENMMLDSRLRLTLGNVSRRSPSSGSASGMVEGFVNNCRSMSAAFGKKMAEMGLSDLSPTGDPPTGGNDLVDVPAIDDATGMQYDIHVKYKSDRLVGLQLPKRGKEDIETFAEKIKKHPNKIYRTIRDEMIASPPQNWPSEKPYDIYDIFLNDATRKKFYAKMESSGFQEEINDVLKNALGYTADATSVALLVNFNSTSSVDIQKLSPGSSDNFDFIVRKPETKEEQKISRAFVVDAVLRSPGKKSKNILNVFYMEIGAAKRLRGLDLHKGEGYQQFIDTLENV